MKPTLWSRRRHRPVALLAAAAATVGGLLAITPQTAGADSAPAAGSGLPTTVAATGLPTMQVNGIVWAQVTVGNTVYATGNFTKARPAGAAVGQNETAVGNIVAYDITTGKMITSFIHSMNGQGQSIAASPDGKTIYVGGQFNTVDSKPRHDIAAFDTATGALVSSFAPYVGGPVQAIVPTNSAVYIGGSFNTAGGQTRSNLAAFTPSSALTAWAPTADDGEVRAMVMSPDRSRLIVGGGFDTLNHGYAAGMGSVDATTGAQLPWVANQTIMDYGSGAMIDTLSTDGHLIYGGGYSFSGTGNFEGRFAADPSTGRIVWVDACNGDTYSTLPIGQVLYSTSHAHDCTAMSAFSDMYPASEPYHRALAETTYAAGTSQYSEGRGNHYLGMPASALLDWFPSMTAPPATPPAGTVAVSGTSQAGWSLTANAGGSYIAIGGEFTAVNSTPQQALVRFAMPSVTKDAAGNANNTTGPVSTPISQPTAAPGTALNSATVTFGTTWDRDNQNLTYRLYRDGGTTAVASTTVASTFWQLPTATLTDTTASPGTHTYVVKVSDPFGNTRSYPPVSTIAAGVTTSLVYSADGGQTWTTTPTVAKGGTVLVREYYNNTAGRAIDATSLKTTLPTGFTRVPNSTQVCLNPGTTDPTHPSAESKCNTNSGQSGAITEGAVWAGSTLTISPTAGVYGQSSSATSGTLAMGKKAYVNLANCAYYGGGTMFLTSVNDIGNPPFQAGTGASNAQATSPGCAPGDGAFIPVPGDSGMQNIDTLDQNRGQGYVQFQMKAPATTGTVTQTATITNGFASAKATIKVS